MPNQGDEKTEFIQPQPRYRLEVGEVVPCLTLGKTPGIEMRKVGKIYLDFEGQKRITLYDESGRSRNLNHRAEVAEAVCGICNFLDDNPTVHTSAGDIPAGEVRQSFLDLLGSGDENMTRLFTRDGNLRNNVRIVYEYLNERRARSK